MDTVRDLLMIESGMIPDSMDFRLPKAGMVCIYKEKIDYSYNKREQWEGLWDTELIYQFPSLGDYVEKWVDEKVANGKSPLEQIEERKGGRTSPQPPKEIEETHKEEEGVGGKGGLCPLYGGIINKQAEAIETLRSA